MKGTDMAGETTLTIIGNLTEDIGLKFVPSGAAVANFTVYLDSVLVCSPRQAVSASGISSCIADT
jgi:single-stranded DNA-binding protein